MEGFNGARVYREDDTIFIPLPKAAWRKGEGTCICPYCKGKDAFYWDTLAVRVVPLGRVNETAWTVHYPSLHPKEG